MSTDILERAGTFDATAVKNWLTREAGNITAISDVVAGLALAVDRAGIPIDRLTVGIPFLLPHILGIQVLWCRGQPVEVRQFPASAESIRQLDDSPVKAAYQEGRATRCRIAAVAQQGEYPIVTDLRGEGYTDYVVLPIKFSDGSNKVVTVATRALSGFTDAQAEALAELMPHLAPVIEVRAMRHLARALLDVYVGPTASGRVLDGEVSRGEGAEIDAVIWFCDLRGSTDLAHALPGPELIALLNRFFGAVTSAVSEHGGEVLKFIGDSVLAIFPCDANPDAGCPAIHGAECAARDALARIAELNEEARQCCGHGVVMGIALHVGRVFYGNVGGEDRLDFTVIGPAVNLAARIESLSAESGNQLLVSEEFARHSNQPYQEFGAFRFKGIDGWRNVYILPQPGGA